MSTNKPTQTVLGGDTRSLRELLTVKPSKRTRGEKRRLKKARERDEMKALDKERRKGNPDYEPIIKMDIDLERKRLEDAQAELHRKKAARRRKDTDNIIAVKTKSIEPLEGFFEFGED